MNIKTWDKIKEAVDKTIERFTDNELDNNPELYESESNYVPYGDTYANTGNEFTDDSIEEARERVCSDECDDIAKEAIDECWGIAELSDSEVDVLESEEFINKLSQMIFTRG